MSLTQAAIQERPEFVSKLQKKNHPLVARPSSSTPWSQLKDDPRLEQVLRALGDHHQLISVGGHVHLDVYDGTPKASKNEEVDKIVLAKSNELRLKKDNEPEHPPLMGIVYSEAGELNSRHLFIQGIPSGWGTVLWEMDRDLAKNLDFGLLVVRNLITAKTEDGKEFLPLTTKTPQHLETIFHPTHKQYVAYEQSYNSIGQDTVPRDVSYRFSSEPVGQGLHFATTSYERTQVASVFLHYVTPLLNPYPNVEVLRSKWNATGQLDLVETSPDAISDYLAANCGNMRPSLRFSVLGFMLANSGLEGLEMLHAKLVKPEMAGSD